MNHDYVKFKNAEREASKLVRKAKRDLERKIAKNIKVDTKFFFKYARSMLKVKSSVGPLADENGNVITDDQKTADTFNEYFSSVFTKEDLSHMPEPKQMFTGGEQEMLKNVDVNETKVKNKLLKLNPSKSAGVDTINPAVLKECAEVLAKPLTILFRKSLESSKVPEIWKYANVTPIFKKGSKSLASNYRPVSLTSIVCRLLESLIVDDIRKHLRDYKLILDTQHGFVEKKSCLSNLLSFLEEVTNYVDQGHPVDILYLDFSKAFDSVPHQRLLSKIRAHGIGNVLVDWIEDWLSGRKQRVVINGCKSGWNDVTSGVPQGSILGPLLFIIFINDIDCKIISALSKFADDTKVFRTVGNVERAFTLQEDLHSLYKWSTDWQLLFNKDKCKCLHVGNNNPQYDYFIGNERIETTLVEKDLGVQISKSLKPEEHIAFIVKKANNLLGCIKRTYSDKSLSNMVNLYITLVRPLLEYCQQVWSPHLVKDVKKVEDVQRRFTRMINGMKGLSYERRLQRCNLIPLERRRERADLIETFKIMNGYVNVDPEKFFTVSKDSRTRGHPMKLQKRHCRLELRRNFYSQRVINPWNKLSKKMIAATSVTQFKTRIHSMYEPKLVGLHMGQ